MIEGSFCKLVEICKRNTTQVVHNALEFSGIININEDRLYLYITNLHDNGKIRVRMFRYTINGMYILHYSDNLKYNECGDEISVLDSLSKLPEEITTFIMYNINDIVLIK